jgi:hypothetical protein
MIAAPSGVKSIVTTIIGKDKQFDDFCHFVSAEWRGTRRHSYLVPNKGKSSAWSQSLPNGVWSAVGLKDALCQYNWNGKSLSENKEQLDELAQSIQRAMMKNDDTRVRSITLEIMRWGGVDNKHRQKRTFAWIKQNAHSISTRLGEAIRQIGDSTNTLEDFDGDNLIMNSAMTKIISLADPDGRLVIYDGRVGSALAFFVTKFAEERGLAHSDLPKVLLFAVDKKRGRNPDTKAIVFPSLFGKSKDRIHATMMRHASEMVTQVAKECGIRAREIEAALFMWGYRVEAMWIHPTDLD